MVNVMSEQPQAPMGWHKEDIKAAIRKRGVTMTDLALQHGVSESAVRRAMVVPSVSGERIVAEFLGVPLWELWPERWTQNGLRIRPRYADKYNAFGRVDK